MMRIAAFLAIVCLAPTVAGACTGDCDDDGVVAVDELVQGVSIALGAGSAAACRGADPDGDDAIAIDELIAAVGSALNGCCGDGSAHGAEECDDGNRTGGDGCTASCRLEPGGDPCAGVPARGGTEIRAELFAGGLDQPVHITAPPLDPNRVFIVEQPGRIRIVERGRLLSGAFLDIRPRVRCCGERGLLSVAFPSDYEQSGRFFVNYTDRAGDTVIARYRVSEDADRADPDSEEILITIDQPPFPNHKGGQVAFGPDGFLYTGMGDGGSANDPLESGQGDDTLLGKILRFDVAVEEAPFYRVPESNPQAGRGIPFGLIWSKGWRNPWRFSFDRANGDLYFGDVGQSEIEEIDVQPADSTGGENYGWDVFEGSRCFEPRPLFEECPSRDGYVFPVTEYTHDEGCSVTGGFVYRGCALPDLHATYFYADYCDGWVRSFVLREGRASEARDWTSALNLPGDPIIDEISSFGEDARGELYVADLGGEVYKLVPAP